MTDNDKEYLAAEIRRLRAEVAAFTSAIPSPSHHHDWLRHFIHDLETNPQTQYKVHLWGAFYWLINFPLVTILFFFDQHHWVVYGVFITLMYSIYANFATDYGAMSAAMAVRRDLPLPDIPMAHVETNGAQEKEM